MLIGELASRTRTSRRQLRYWEQAGLLTSARRVNGYRDYDEAAIMTVTQVRALRQAGLPTETIRYVLPCTLSDGTLTRCPGILEALKVELLRLDARAADIERTRRALRHTIAHTEVGT